MRDFQLHRLFAQTMHTVFRADDNRLHLFRNFYAGFGAGEGLFFDMGMMEDPFGQDLAGCGLDLPAIGIMIPALVCMFQSRANRERALGGFADVCVYDARVVRPDKAGGYKSKSKSKTCDGYGSEHGEGLGGLGYRGQVKRMLLDLGASVEIGRDFNFRRPKSCP